MAEEIHEKPEDITNIPDPAITNRCRIQADVVFIIRELNIETGMRLWVKFRKTQRKLWGVPEDDKVEKDLYHQKVGLYISQAGKSPIIWVDDQFWKVERRKKLAPVAGEQQVSLKIDVQPLNIKESRVQSLRRCISELSVL